MKFGLRTICPCRRQNAFAMSSREGIPSHGRNPSHGFDRCQWLNPEYGPSTRRGGSALVRGSPDIAGRERRMGDLDGRSVLVSCGRVIRNQHSALPCGSRSPPGGLGPGPWLPPCGPTDRRPPASRSTQPPYTKSTPTRLARRSPPSGHGCALSHIVASMVAASSSSAAASIVIVFTLIDAESRRSAAVTRCRMLIASMRH